MPSKPSTNVSQTVDITPNDSADKVAKVGIRSDLLSNRNSMTHIHVENIIVTHFVMVVYVNGLGIQEAK